MEGKVSIGYRDYLGSDGRSGGRKVTHVVGRDGVERPARVYDDAIGQPLSKTATTDAIRAREASHDARAGKTRAELARAAAGLDAHVRTKPVTARGKAARAANMPDWREIDMRAEAEAGGVAVEDLPDYSETPAQASARALDAALEGIAAMTYEHKARLHGALLDSGFNPDADTRL